MIQSIRTELDAIRKRLDELEKVTEKPKELAKSKKK